MLISLEANRHKCGFPSTSRILVTTFGLFFEWFSNRPTRPLFSVASTLQIRYIKLRHSQFSYNSGIRHTMQGALAICIVVHIYKLNLPIFDVLVFKLKVIHVASNFRILGVSFLPTLCFLASNKFSRVLTNKVILLPWLWCHHTLALYQINILSGPRSNQDLLHVPPEPFGEYLLSIIIMASRFLSSIQPVYL